MSQSNAIKHIKKEELTETPGDESCLACYPYENQHVHVIKSEKLDLQELHGDELVNDLVTVKVEDPGSDDDVKNVDIEILEDEGFSFQIIVEQDEENCDHMDEQKCTEWSQRSVKCPDWPPGSVKCQLSESKCQERPSKTFCTSTHEQKKYLTCLECGRNFTQSGHFNEHMRIHTGERPYVCHICKHSFARSDTLRNHIKVHSGSKPFVCTQCDAAFARNESLKRHLRYHTGTRPYVCQECGVRYTEPVSLRRHMRKHTGERPYSCPFCAKAFAVRHSLKRHIASHTGEKNFKCEVCGKRFARRYAMAAHTRTEHGIREEQSCEK